MAAFNLKRFAHPDALAAINERYLRELLWPFRAYLKQRGLKLTKHGPIDHALLLTIVMTPDADGADLTDALHVIHEMATYRGMDSILEAMSLADLGLECHLGLHPADVAVRAWVVNRDLLQRKHAERFVHRYRAFDYFRSFVHPPPPPNRFTARRRSRLEATLDEAFAHRLRGRGVKVFDYPRASDSTCFLVRHGDPVRREGTMAKGRPSSVVYRPLRFDVVVYDAVAGELRVHAANPWEVLLYRQQFGICLFDDIGSFPSGPKYTLAPLRDDGAASLRCLDVPGLRAVVLREVHLRWAGEQQELEIHKAPDVFEAIRKRNGSLPASPALVRATFGVHFTDSNEPRAVTVAPPNVALYSQDDDAAVVEPWLAARGFIRKAGVAAQATAAEAAGTSDGTIGSLLAGAETVAGQSAVRADWDRALRDDAPWAAAAGLLRPSGLLAQAYPRDPLASPSPVALRVVAHADGTFAGVCPDCTEVVPLDREQLVLWELDRPRLCRLVASALGVEDLFEADVLSGTSRIGMYALEHTSGRSVPVYLTLPLETPDLTLTMHSIVAMHGDEGCVLLAPTRRLLADGCVAVMRARRVCFLAMNEALLPVGDGRLTAARALGDVLAEQWRSRAVDRPPPREDGWYPPRTLVYRGREHAVELTKKEIAFLDVALRQDEVDVHTLMNRASGLVFKATYRAEHPERNRISQFLSRLGARLSKATPPVPVLFSLPRDSDHVLRHDPPPPPR